ncbi:MAG: cell wall hydrolase [Geminicoccaceae bacterium]
MHPNRPNRLSCALIAVLALVTAMVGFAARAGAAEDQGPAYCLALAMYFEARSEGREAMEAVGWVVLNRVAAPEFPDTVCGVVEQGREHGPCQFSWWCDERSNVPTEKAAWAKALELADEMLANPGQDPTGQALFFHDTTVEPDWTGLERISQIGVHVFYR